MNIFFLYRCFIGFVYPWKKDILNSFSYPLHAYKHSFVCLLPFLPLYTHAKEISVVYAVCWWFSNRQKKNTHRISIVRCHRNKFRIRLRYHPYCWGRKWFHLNIYRSLHFSHPNSSAVHISWQFSRFSIALSGSVYQLQISAHFNVVKHKTKHKNNHGGTFLTRFFPVYLFSLRVFLI